MLEKLTEFCFTNWLKKFSVSSLTTVLDEIWYWQFLAGLWKDAWEIGISRYHEINAVVLSEKIRKKIMQSKGFCSALTKVDQKSPENNSAATGTGGYSWVNITPAPNSRVLKKRGTKICSASPETQAWRSCRRHNRTIICLGHLQGFFRRNVWAKLSGLAELSC